MKTHIQNVIDLLNEAIENEDFSLVLEAKNILESEDSFEEFEDLDYQGMNGIDQVCLTRSGVEWYNPTQYLP